jgi:hypothetical protein
VQSTLKAKLPLPTERTESGAILVTWGLWRLRVAKRSGFCAVSPPPAGLEAGVVWQEGSAARAAAEERISRKSRRERGDMAGLRVVSGQWLMVSSNWYLGIGQWGGAFCGRISCSKIGRMILRWVMRGLSVALLALCVGAWVESHYRWECIGTKFAGRDRRVAVDTGTVFYASSPGDRGDRWYWIHGPARRENSQFVFELCEYKGGGFGLKMAGRDSAYSLIVMPMWLPTLIGGVVVWAVWSQTRGRKAGNGFPVETGNVKK